MFQFWMQHKPRATVCFGFDAKEDFELLFGPLECRLRETSIYYVDSENKILLTRHFSRGVSPDIENQVVERLKDWNVTRAA